MSQRSYFIGQYRRIGGRPARPVPNLKMPVDDRWYNCFLDHDEAKVKAWVIAMVRSGYEASAWDLAVGAVAGK